MPNTKPFGNLHTAKILVIGHDPRLQKSNAKAEVAFFFDYLKKYETAPTYGAERSKYGLANGVWEYVNYLAGGEITLESLFVTNLCNEFIDHVHGSGIVLIPDDAAERGIEAIQDVISQASFKLVLPMAAQTFYQLCRLGFLDEDSELIRNFVLAARPVEGKAKLGIYKPVGRTPFLEVCGKCFHHQGIPVVPILHVKQWKSKNRSEKYDAPMENARSEVRGVINYQFPCKNSGFNNVQKD